MVLLSFIVTDSINLFLLLTLVSNDETNVTDEFFINISNL